MREKSHVLARNSFSSLILCITLSTSVRVGVFIEGSRALLSIKDEEGKKIRNDCFIDR